jgi:hypothetical protein
MRILFILAPFSLCVLSSCHKDNEIRTYKVATDSIPDAPTSPAMARMDGIQKPQESHAPADDSVVWQAPADWKQEEATQFLTAAYALPGGGRVTVSKLGGDGGGLAANINRWRGQLGFKPIAEKDVVGQPLKLPDSDDELLLFNLTAENADPDAKGILAGVLPLKLETWYFKFSGPVGVLRKSEGEFVEFLRSIHHAGMVKTTLEPASSGGKEIHVIAPDGWVASKGSSMRVASFSVAGPDGTSVDVSVVLLGGDAGSVFENVNRWRAQLQLPPLSSADDPALGKKEQIPAGEAFISHMTSTELVHEGKKAAIGAAILKRSGKTWFFKITGEASLVQANLDKFDSFVRSATFP